MKHAPLSSIRYLMTSLVYESILGKIPTPLVLHDLDRNYVRPSFKIHGLALGFLKRIEVLGTEGSAIIEEENLTAWQFAREEKEDAAIRETYLHATSTGGGAADPAAISYVPHQKQFEAFVRSIRKGEEPEITGESASKAIDIICAAYESAQTGKPVVLG